MSDNNVICGNIGCKVASDGKCLEGLELAKCPFYGKTPVETVSVSGRPAAALPELTNGVALGSGSALEAKAASDILRRAVSRVVAIIGAHDSGKTSLIAGIYDCFQMGRIGEAAFAGSSTLHAFEQACHDARAASLRNVAHSPRTGRGEVRFYHLDVKLSDRDAHLSLVIGDRSGEEYEEVTDDIANAGPMFEMRRAQAVTILVDGDRLCKGDLRHEAVGAVGMIVQGLIEGAAIEGRPRLAVVLTKNDAVLASPHAARVMSDFDRILAGLRTRHAGMFTTIEAFVIAASPKNGGPVRGSGLGPLLNFWLEPPERADSHIRPVTSGRIFDSLQMLEDR